MPSVLWRCWLVRQEGNLGSGYKNTDLKWSRKRIELSPSHRSSSSAESNRSALTDHAVQENHVISWSAASIIDRESDRSTRWIKEAVHIRKEGPRSINRDEGSYQLSHTYDRLVGSTLTCRAKNRKRRRLNTSFFWWRPLTEVETSKVKNFLFFSMRFLLVWGTVMCYLVMMTMISNCNDDDDNAQL